jgi:hypothetical protein
MTGRDQAGGHRASHDAQTEKGNTHLLLLNVIGVDARSREPLARRPELMI